MLLGCQNSPFAEMDPVKGIAEISTWPIEALEFVADKPRSMPHQIDEASRLEIRRVVDNAGLRLTVHSPFKGQDLTSPFPWKAKRSMGDAEAALDLASDLGAVGLVVHPGRGRVVPGIPFAGRLSFWDRLTTPFRNGPPPRPDNTRRNVDVIGQLLNKAQERQVEVYLENLPRMRRRKDIFKEILGAHPDLNICYDYGHSLISNWEWLIDDYFERLRYVHYHVNAGEADEHKPITADDRAAKEFLRMLIERGFDGTLMIEPKVGDLEGAKESVKNTRRMLDEISSSRSGGKAS